MREWIKACTHGVVLPVLLAVTACGMTVEPPPDADAWRQLEPAQVASHLDELLTQPARAPDYWCTKPRLPRTFYYPAQPIASADDREAARRMKAGDFRANELFDWLPLGVPPPWKENPLNSNTWDMWRHALAWTEPLVNVWITDQDPSSLALLRRIFADWIEHNSLPPGGSAYAWGDHTVAVRLRVLCWFWELSRTCDTYDPAFARLLLSAVFQHATCICDPKMYPERSNHGLEMTGSLLAAAITFPEFKRAADWEQLARERFSRYIAQNYSPEGFHLEQSPAYHCSVLGRINDMLLFIRGNGRDVAPEDLVRLRRAAAVWPYLRKPDGRLPTIGDTPAVKRASVVIRPELLGGEAAIKAALPPTAAQRPDGAHFLFSFAAGYAIFTASPPETPRPDADTYVLFKCNAFPGTHAHRDTLSFIVYGLRRDWLMDAGQFSYEEDTPERQYMRSARAHNVVLVDGKDFDFHPVQLIDWGRTAEYDQVSVRQELPSARHTRTLAFHPLRLITLRDELAASDGQQHRYAQLFHAAPDVRVEPVDDRVLLLRAPDGAACRIAQDGAKGRWRVVIGQREPVMQGWYSPAFGELLPAAAIYYETPEPHAACTFETRIELVPAAAATTSKSAASKRDGRSRRERRRATHDRAGPGLGRGPFGGLRHRRSVIGRGHRGPEQKRLELGQDDAQIESITGLVPAAVSQLGAALGR
jgi:hypothetical protein